MSKRNVDNGYNLGSVIFVHPSLAEGETLDIYFRVVFFFFFFSFIFLSLAILKVILPPFVPLHSFPADP